jgi:hypothetical protein
MPCSPRRYPADDLGVVSRNSEQQPSAREMSYMVQLMISWIAV